MAEANTFESLLPLYKESYSDKKSKKFSKLKKTLKKKK